MSSSSDSSGPSSAGESEAASPEKLARRILRKLGHAPLHQTMAVADHRKATEAMVRLKEMLHDGVPVDAGVGIALTCAGIALQRRIAIGPEHTEAYAQLHTTLALLFVLVVLVADAAAALPTGSDEAERAAEVVATWERSPLIEQLRSAETDAASSSWARVLRDPGALCTTLVSAARQGGASATLAELAAQGTLFFRASSAAMAAQLLDRSGPAVDGNSFLTLDTVAFVTQANDHMRAERLSGIADCAESEAGQTVRAFHFEPCSPLRTTAYLPPGAQSATTMSFHSPPVPAQVLRDLILSFKLPRGVVGVRRTCLLSRDSNAVATEKHPNVLGVAHDAAMRGAKWSWEKDADQLHQMCALLAGLAVQMCTNAQSVRRDDMFNGRVQLPFLETHPVEPGVVRMALVEHSHEWVVYSTNVKGEPTVKLRQAGYDGMVAAALLFVATL